MPPRHPLLAVALAFLLGACASVEPVAPPRVADAPVVLKVTETPVPAPEAAVVPAPVAANPFPIEVRADIITLPPPSEDLWVRIRKGFAMNPVSADPRRVAKWEKWYAERPDYVARMIDRSRRYLYHIAIEVESRGMPMEIALLPMVESAFNPNAMSTARAAGLWQFIPSTGKVFGLKQDFWADSRRDVIAGTNAALNYLAKLHDQFGDWQLVLAAYNWGEGNVERALEKSRRAGKPARLENFKMPDETRNYLPKLQAVKNIVGDPRKYGLELGDLPDAPYFAIVKTGKRMDVKRAAELAEMSEEDFLSLNPHHNRPVIAGADEFSILLPIDRAETFAAKLELIDQPMVSWQAYRVRSNETLAQVATRFQMPVETLRAVNGLGAKAKPAAGFTLLVPAENATAAAEDTLVSAVFTTVPQGRTFYYRVNRGDTLSGIAARYRVSTEDLQRWNGLAQNRIAAGQQLRITSDLAPNASHPKRAAGPAPTPAAPRRATEPTGAAAPRPAPPTALVPPIGSTQALAVPVR